VSSGGGTHRGGCGDALRSGESRRLLTLHQPLLSVTQRPLPLASRRLRRLRRRLRRLRRARVLLRVPVRLSRPPPPTPLPSAAQRSEPWTPTSTRGSWQLRGTLAETRPP
jgi:hypothetical protein